MKETDRVAETSNENKRPHALVPLTGVYLLSMLVTLSHLGDPFPFMGALYEGDAAEHLIFADSIVSLYLIVGILKRQRLTLWLLVGYNFLASCNGISNLLLLPVQQVMTATGTMVPDYHYRVNAFCVFVLFLFLNVFLYFNRNRFDNKSIYLW